MFALFSEVGVTSVLPLGVLQLFLYYLLKCCNEEYSYHHACFEELGKW